MNKKTPKHQEKSLVQKTARLISLGIATTILGSTLIGGSLYLFDQSNGHPILKHFSSELAPYASKINEANNKFGIKAIKNDISFSRYCKVNPNVNPELLLRNKVIPAALIKFTDPKNNQFDILSNDMIAKLPIQKVLVKNNPQIWHDIRNKRGVKLREYSGYILIAPQKIPECQNKLPLYLNHTKDKEVPKDFKESQCVAFTFSGLTAYPKVATIETAMIKHEIGDGTVKQYVATFAGHIIAQDSIFTRKAERVIKNPDEMAEIIDAHNSNRIESCDGREFSHNSFNFKRD